MSTIATNNITDSAGSGAPNFTNGLKLNTNAVLGPVTGDAPMYACRAWVNFNGTGTVAIRASGNVSSITDNGAGDYTVNFTTAMPDENYAVQITASRIALNDGAGISCWVSSSDTRSAGSKRIRTAGVSSSSLTIGDLPDVYVSIFR